MNVVELPTKVFHEEVGGGAENEALRLDIDVRKVLTAGVNAMRAKPRLIGLTGKARSGKDTVAGMLQSAFGFKTIAFAKPLKEGLKTMLGLTEEHVNGSLKEVVIEDFGKSPRQMLQTLGTEWGRETVHDMIWLTVARRQVNVWLEQGYNVVITDVRFENEAEMIRKMGGEIWHIHRPDATQVAAHSSESGIVFTLADYLIYNNSTLDDLFDTVFDALLEGNSHG